MWLAAIAVGAALLAGAVVIGSEKLSDNSDDTHAQPAHQSNALDPSKITVDVLNGTTASGLAAKVGSDIEGAGYKLGPDGNLGGASVGQTVVYFQPKDKLSEKAANKVANVLGNDTPVQEITPEAQKLASDADVVVVAGDDRAR